MNPLTQIKNTQKASKLEISQGFSESASWHARFKHSAYVFAGGLPYDLTEGDVLAIFSQYGELVDINLVKDKDTGKPKGFAFLAYEDQRSTTLAVDNLSGARVTGRTIRVEHVDNYKRKKAEVEGREQSPDTGEEEEEEEEAEEEAERDTAPAGRAAAPAARLAGQSNGAAPAGQDAWMGSNSLFNMLRDDDAAALLPKPGAVAAAAPGEKKARKEKKEKKEKKAKKEKKSHKDKGHAAEARASPDALRWPPAALPAERLPDVRPQSPERRPAGTEADGRGRPSRPDDDRHGGAGGREAERGGRGSDSYSRERQRSPPRRREEGERRDERERSGSRKRIRSPGGGRDDRGR